MKHSYTVGCDCQRCTKELTRRTAQSASDPRRLQQVKRKRTRKPATRKPVHGSAEWAETRGDDFDYGDF